MYTVLVYFNYDDTTLTGDTMIKQWVTAYKTCFDTCNYKPGCATRCISWLEYFKINYIYNSLPMYYKHFKIVLHNY